MDWMIGKPYSFKSFNCWEYSRKIREQAGIKTHVFTVKNLKDAFETIQNEMLSSEHGLIKVSSASNFDVIIARKAKGDKNIYHCGVFFNGDVRHCSRTLKQVVNESFNDFIKQYDDYSIWR